MQINKFRGLIAAPFTPMKVDGSVNADIITSYAEKLKSDGVKGVFICGTTGEGMLMSSDERKTVAEAWIKEQKNNFKVIVHVGTTSSKQSNELAQHAQKAGAYAVGCMGPVFLKPARVEELVDFCAEVATGSPGLPFYYYHIPAVSGINLSMSEFIRKAAPRIPNFTGIKFTDNNFMEMQQCLDIDNSKYDILHGYDELLLAGLVFGAKAAIGSTYNFMAPLYNEIINDVKNGDIEEAKRKQLTSVKIIAILNSYGGAIVSGKRLMKTVGIDCGDFRSPVTKFKENEYENFIDDLKNAGFFKIIKS
ncbi:dihydrodipicolinate synthase family protein [bacterium]|nr:dihydrodipicolinate synthase family protein [bacterium]